ncbi:retropepsin-like domain-containing protein [Paenibacillus tritici]|uniref:aspartyl protease family protein n=1 Tax=Paenibacillus tritici TaxID=1873425 RepID=UPI001BA71DCD|nr:aspartyl protease family protein [Paenibacillus tritici]QUL53971.1 retropepsin-like domain-containing protein [Paenibacillus tritici]
MKLQLQHGLPIVSLTVAQYDKWIVLQNVLFDTGCAATVFDSDALAAIGIDIDFINGRAKRMYGVGGTSEICYEQQIHDFTIEHIALNDFPIQLGSIQEPYGFEGIVGIDFMMRAKCKVDFETMTIEFEKQTK